MTTYPDYSDLDEVYYYLGECHFLMNNTTRPSPSSPRWSRTTPEQKTAKSATKRLAEIEKLKQTPPKAPSHQAQEELTPEGSGRIAMRLGRGRIRAGLAVLRGDRARRRAGRDDRAGRRPAERQDASPPDWATNTCRGRSSGTEIRTPPGSRPASSPARADFGFDKGVVFSLSAGLAPYRRRRSDLRHACPSVSSTTGRRSRASSFGAEAFVPVHRYSAILRSAGRAGSSILSACPRPGRSRASPSRARPKG